MGPNARAIATVICKHRSLGQICCHPRPHLRNSNRRSLSSVQNRVAGTVQAAGIPAHIAASDANWPTKQRFANYTPTQVREEKVSGGRGDMGPNARATSTVRCVDTQVFGSKMTSKPICMATLCRIGHPMTCTTRTLTNSVSWLLLFLSNLRM